MHNLIAEYLIMKCFILQYLLLNHLMETNINTNSSWIAYNSSEEHFPIQNIPLGVAYFIDNQKTRCCTRIGEIVIDLSILEANGFFTSVTQNCFEKPDLNGFIQLGRSVWKSVRTKIQKIFSNSEYENHSAVRDSMVHISKVRMRMPVKIQDYTDFYSSKNHAYNMGKIIRGEKDALQPNWVHLPVAYHGRSSTIVVDSTAIKRPRGQIKPPNLENPIFSKCKRLDYEVEVGVIIGKTKEMGSPIKVKILKIIFSV